MTPPVPRLVVLTDRQQVAAVGGDVATHAQAAARAGADAVVLREKDLPPDERRALAFALADALADTNTVLVVAGDSDLARAVGAGGLHLAADQPLPATPVGGLLLRSCHDDTEVARARRERVDAAVVSPVAATASKPGYGPPLGADGLRHLVATAGDVPVLALGGVTPDNVAGWCEAGAHGVVVMGAVMRARDPGEVVTRLRDALDHADRPQAAPPAAGLAAATTTATTTDRPETR